MYMYIYKYNTLYIYLYINKYINKYLFYIYIILMYSTCMYRTVEKFLEKKKKFI